MGPTWGRYAPFGAKRGFLEIFFIAIFIYLFIYLVHYIIVQNFKINPLIGFQEVVVKARGFSLGKKALILGQKKFS